MDHKLGGLSRVGGFLQDWRVYQGLAWFIKGWRAGSWMVLQGWTGFQRKMADGFQQAIEGGSVDLDISFLLV